MIPFFVSTLSIFPHNHTYTSKIFPTSLSARFCHCTSVSLLPPLRTHWVSLAVTFLVSSPTRSVKVLIGPSATPTSLQDPSNLSTPQPPHHHPLCLSRPLSPSRDFFEPKLRVITPSKTP